MNIQPIYTFAIFCFLLIVMSLTVKYAPFIFLLWSLVLLVFPTFRTDLFGIPIYWYDVVTVILIFHFVLLYKSKIKYLVPSSIWRWFLGFFLVYLIFGFFVPSFKFSIITLTLWIFLHSFLAIFGLLFGSAISYSLNSEYKRYLTTGIFISSLVLCCLALLQFFSIHYAELIDNFFYGSFAKSKTQFFHKAFIRTKRVYGPHQAPTTFAGVSLINGFLLLWLIKEKNWKKIVGITASIISILLTFSRHGIIALFAGVLVIFLFDKLKTTKQLIAIIGSIFLIVILSHNKIILNVWRSRFERGGITTDPNIYSRLVRGPKNFLERIEEEPYILLLGTGLDVQKLMHKAKLSRKVMFGFVSNGFLLALFHLSIWGFLLYVGFWIKTFIKSLLLPKFLSKTAIPFIFVLIIIIASDNYSFLYEPVVSFLFLSAGLILGEYYRIEYLNRIRNEATSYKRALLQRL